MATKPGQQEPAGNQQDHDQESARHDVDAVNEVDTSPERIARELDQAAIDEGLAPGAHTESGSGFELHQDDDALQRDQAVPRVAGILGWVFGLGFTVFAPAWRITSDEVARLSAVWSRVVAKWLPLSWLQLLPDVTGGEGSACVECDAIAVSFQVLHNRIGTPMQENPETGQAAPGAQARRESETVQKPQPGAMLDIHGQA